MNIEQLVELLKVLEGPKTTDKPARQVIVRSRDAGVLFGCLIDINGSNVQLTNAVQMWRWKAKKGGTLVDCATFGVDPGGCKFSEAAGDVIVINACAVIDCTPDAFESLCSAKSGNWS